MPVKPARTGTLGAADSERVHPAQARSACTLERKTIAGYMLQAGLGPTAAKSAAAPPAAFRHRLGRAPQTIRSVWIADLFGSQIQGDLIGASQWRIYQGVAKEFESATSDSFP